MTGMADWRDYAYCKHCDRPLRDAEYTGSRGDNGWLYHCRICDRRCDRLELFDSLPSLAGLIIMITTFWLGTYLYFKDVATPDDIKDTAIFVFLVILLLVGGNLWKRFKLKSIYDYWVTRHGTDDPDKWPDPDRY